MNILEQLLDKRMKAIETEQSEITEGIHRARRLGEHRVANRLLGFAHRKGFQWKAMSDLADKTELQIEDIQNLS
ncbi:hypothetical protein HY345_02925 [Candidatus Microgenomates bacterium]|nr:hypothetical protein [Candidatus Microgenomates bacterium]